MPDIKEIVLSIWIEGIAAFTGVLSVWFAKKEHILVYPIGIISVGLYVLICFYAKIYADAFINLYYLVISLYGWYFWMFGGNMQSGRRRDAGTKAVIVTSTVRQIAVMSFITASMYLILGYLLQRYTDSNVPWADAFNSSLFIVAMYLMARKNISHWIFWIIGDLASIPLYIYKHLYVTALQYGIFLLIAVAGYMAWRKKLDVYIDEIR